MVVTRWRAAIAEDATRCVQTGLLRQDRLGQDNECLLTCFAAWRLGDESLSHVLCSVPEPARLRSPGSTKSGDHGVGELREFGAAASEGLRAEQDRSKFSLAVEPEQRASGAPVSAGGLWQ